MKRLALLALIIAAHPRAAHAFASSCRYDGWAVPAGTTIPTHGKLGFYTDARDPLSKKPLVMKAKIGGKDVPVKLTYTAAGPWELVQIEIDSDLAGTLELAWQMPKGSDRHLSAPLTARYTVVKKLAMPKEVRGTATRFHRAFHHSTVHESEDGLAVKVDAHAVAFTARWRLDDKAAWQTLVIPAGLLATADTAQLGEVGCQHNFSTAILEKGIDLELTAQLADGSAVKVSGLPAHYTLPALPKGADVSSP